MSTHNELASNAIRIYLSYSLREAEDTLTRLQVEVRMHSYGAGNDSCWNLVIMNANRVVRYVKNCQADDEQNLLMTVGIAGLAALDRAQEALLRSIRGAREFDGPLHSVMNLTVERSVRSAKYMVNANIAAQSGDRELSELWLLASQSQDHALDLVHLLPPPQDSPINNNGRSQISFPSMPANPSRATIMSHQQLRRAIVKEILYGPHDPRVRAAQAAALYFEKEALFRGLVRTDVFKDISVKVAELYVKAAEVMHSAGEMCNTDPECCDEDHAPKKLALTALVHHADLLVRSAESVRATERSIAAWCEKRVQWESAAKRYHYLHPVIGRASSELAAAIDVHLQKDERFINLLMSGEADAKATRWEDYALRTSSADLLKKFEIAHQLAANCAKMEYYEQQARIPPRNPSASQEMQKECWLLAAKHVRLSLAVAAEAGVEVLGSLSTENMQLKRMRFQAAISRDCAHIAQGLLATAVEYHSNALNCGEEEGARWTNAAQELISAAALSMQHVQSLLNEVEADENLHEHSARHSAHLQSQPEDVSRLVEGAQLHIDCVLFIRELARVSALNGSHFVHTWLVRQWRKLMDLQQLIINHSSGMEESCLVEAKREMRAQVQTLHKHSAPHSTKMSTPIDLVHSAQRMDYAAGALRAKIANKTEAYKLWENAIDRMAKVSTFWHQNEPYPAELLQKSASNYALAAQAELACLAWDCWLYEEIASQYHEAFLALLTPSGTNKRSLHLTVATMLTNHVHCVKDAFEPVGDVSDAALHTAVSPDSAADKDVPKIELVEETDPAILSLAESITSFVVKGANCVHEGSLVAEQDTPEKTEEYNYWHQASILCANLVEILTKSVVDMQPADVSTETPATTEAVPARDISEPQPAWSTDTLNAATQQPPQHTAHSHTESALDAYINAAVAAREGCLEVAKLWVRSAKQRLLATDRDLAPREDLGSETVRIESMLVEAAQHFRFAAEAGAAQDDILCQLHINAAKAASQLHTEWLSWSWSVDLNRTEQPAPPSAQLRQLKSLYNAANWKVQAHIVECAAGDQGILAAELWRLAAHRAEEAALIIKKVEDGTMRYKTEAPTALRIALAEGERLAAEAAAQLS